MTRNLVLAALQSALRVTLRLLSLIFPQSRSVVLGVFPESEGNGVQTARALLERYDGQVVWLTESPAPSAEVCELVAQGMVLVRKASLAGLWRYLRAEAVFFTHGLYGSPRPRRRKPLVNLWHGDGPKATRPGLGRGSLIPSTYLVASTGLFGSLKATAFEVPKGRLLVTGNPRTDRFWQAPDSAALETLGITGDFVVWMPTFRRTRAVGAVRRWSEGETATTRAGLTQLRALREGLAQRGVQLVIKPHPMDAEERLWDGAVTITEDDLVAASVPLYSLLGLSRGLVTDYSSVWVDYLLLDRPMAFFVADRHMYKRELVPADVLEWAPGELVDGDPFAEFLADLDSGGRNGAAQREAVAIKIGLNPTHTSADDLVDELHRRGVL